MGGVFVLASLIIIGIFFIYGYFARLARNVIAGAERPLPSWDDLGDYFNEGLRVFGVALVYTLPLIVLGMFFLVPMIFMQAGGSQVVRDAGGMMATCVWCLIFPLSLAVGIWLPAALTFVAVEQRFSAGFEFGRIWSYMRANAGNYVLAYVCWLIARFAVPFGMILFCIGIVFTIFWAYAVAVYAFAQTYRLSLER